MPRLVLALVFFAPALALAGPCNVSGTAYDVHGKPMRGLVRLIDLQTQQTAFSTTDANAAFTFDAALPNSGPYRLDLISAPTRVTGSRIPTRSIIGMSDSFSCGAQLAHQDVHAQVE
jgi:hypothetical protein